MNYKEFKQLVNKYHISEEDVYQIAQYFADEKLKRKFVDTQIKDLYDKMNIQDCDISIESFDVKPNTFTDILALKYLKIQGEEHELDKIKQNLIKQLDKNNVNYGSEHYNDHIMTFLVMFSIHL
jgi:predicted nucleotidyltransferase component of viral defense system